MQTIARPFLECHVRRRVRAMPNVTVVDICMTAGGRVTGVRVAGRSSRLESTLQADLVVDATGRGTRTPALFKRAGYAQGMTVAALEALVLRDCLSRGADDLPRRFFRAPAKMIGQAWQLAAGGDLGLPEIEGTPPLVTRLLIGYINRILSAAEYDTTAFEQCGKVAWLADSPAKLIRPSTIRRALVAHRRNRHRNQEVAYAPLTRI